jgi:hypothetical protein
MEVCSEDGILCEVQSFQEFFLKVLGQHWAGIFQQL